MSRYIKELPATHTRLIISDFNSSVSSEGNLAERKSCCCLQLHFCLHRQKCRDWTYCTTAADKPERKLWQGENGLCQAMFLKGANYRSLSCVPPFMIYLLKANASWSCYRSHLLWKNNYIGMSHSKITIDVHVWTMDCKKTPQKSCCAVLNINKSNRV